MHAACRMWKSKHSYAHNWPATSLLCPFRPAACVLLTAVLPYAQNTCSFAQVYSTGRASRTSQMHTQPIFAPSSYTYPSFTSQQPVPLTNNRSVSYQEAAIEHAALPPIQPRASSLPGSLPAMHQQPYPGYHQHDQHLLQAVPLSTLKPHAVPASSACQQGGHYVHHPGSSSPLGSIGPPGLPTARVLVSSADMHEPHFLHPPSTVTMGMSELQQHHAGQPASAAHASPSASMQVATAVLPCRWNNSSSNLICFACLCAAWLPSRLTLHIRAHPLPSHVAFCAGASPAITYEGSSSLLILFHTLLRAPVGMHAAVSNAVLTCVSMQMDLSSPSDFSDAGPSRRPWSAPVQTSDDRLDLDLDALAMRHAAAAGLLEPGQPVTMEGSHIQGTVADNAKMG